LRLLSLGDTTSPHRVKFLKSQLATKLTIETEYRADFWECLRGVWPAVPCYWCEVFELFESQLALNWPKKVTTKLTFENVYMGHGPRYPAVVLKSVVPSCLSACQKHSKVYFVKEPYKRDDILQKRPINIQKWAAQLFRIINLVWAAH